MIQSHRPYRLVLVVDRGILPFRCTLERVHDLEDVPWWEVGSPTTTPVVAEVGNTVRSFFAKGELGTRPSVDLIPAERFRRKDLEGIDWDVASLIECGVSEHDLREWGALTVDYYAKVCEDLRAQVDQLKGQAKP